MRKEQVEQEISKADADPRIAKELKKVVEEIDNGIVKEDLRGMMYNLVHVVLEMDERIRQLEYRVCGNTVQEELRRQKRMTNKKSRYFQPVD